MSAHTSKAGFVPLSRTQLARIEFNRAHTELWAELHAGRISRTDASAKFDALLAAYRKTKEDLKQSAFMARALGQVVEGVF